MAFTFDSLVADPLQLPKSADRENAWRIYDSMRVGHAARWTLHATGHIDAAAARLHLAVVHKETTELAKARAVDGALPPVISYLIVFALIHELWHTEDLIHMRHVHRLPPPMLLRPNCAPVVVEDGGAQGDARIPGGVYYLGTARTARFAFDCEKWCCVPSEPLALGSPAFPDATPRYSAGSTR